MKLLIIDDATGSPTHQYRLLHEEDEALKTMLEIGKATAKDRENDEVLAGLETLSFEEGGEDEEELQTLLERMEVYFWIRDIEVGGEVVAL